MTTQSEIDRLFKMCSAYSALVSSLENQLFYVQEQSARQQEAMLTLESERGANSLLTNEIQELETKIKRMTNSFFRLETLVFSSPGSSLITGTNSPLKARWDELRGECYRDIGLSM